MTKSMETNDQQVCNECGRHCPMDALRCDRGRRAAGIILEDYESGESGEHRERGKYEERRDCRESGEHGNRGERGGRREHGGHGEHRERGNGRERGERRHRFHGLDTGAEGLEGLYARFMQCGHYLHHSGREDSSQRKILLILSENGGEMNQRELTEELGIHRASVSELLGKLENKGMIVRRQDEEDRRCARISLTEKGNEVLREDGRRQESPDLEQLFGILSEEEKNSLYTILGKLVKEWNGTSKDRAER